MAGQEKIDIWRSETLTALTALHENETRLERASRRICSDLSGIISPWLLEAGPFAKVEGRFRREILDPAIKLHQDLRSSSHRYDTRLIPISNEISPKQMLDEWDLKDADKWQKPRGEKEVGKALYCLHPPIFRLRGTGRPPIVVAKAVIVVANPERERVSNLHGNKDSLPSGVTVLPAAIESSPATAQIMSSLDQENPPQSFADGTSVSTDSDSTTTSRSRQYDFNSRRASTHPSTQKQEYLHEHPRRRLSVPLESPDGKRDLPRDSRSYFEEELQSSGRARKDPDGRPYRRGHHIEGTSNNFPSQLVAARQPSRRGSRDASRDQSSPRRSAVETSQLPIAPAPPVPSTPSAKARAVKIWPFARQ